jgi:hypothetical protein
MAALIHFTVFCFLLAFVTCIPMKMQCKYIKVAMILDCANRGLNQIPVPGPKEKNRLVRVLDLRKNNITSGFENVVLQLYPGLVMIDFRENPIDCTRFVFSKVKIMVDCKSMTRTVRTNMVSTSAVYNTPFSQNCYRTNSATMVSSLCQTCVSIRKKRFQLPWSISSIVKSSDNSPYVRDGKTKIILLTTIIPIIFFIALSIIIYRLCSRCTSRQITQEHNQNVETFQMGSLATTTTNDTDESLSSVELYTAQV